MYTEKPLCWSVTTALGSTILIPPGRMRRSGLWWSGSSQGHTASAWGRVHGKVTTGNIYVIWSSFILPLHYGEAVCVQQLGVSSLQRCGPAQLHMW